LIQNATDTGEGSLIFFLFDLLHLDGENLMALPLMDRKARLASLLNGASGSLRYNDHQIGHGPAFHRLACERGLEGIVSKRTDGRYEADRRSWLKVKCLNREEFVVVGWSDPEGSRHRIGALLLGYYTPDGKLIYAGRAGTGLPEAELERLWQQSTRRARLHSEGTRDCATAAHSRAHSGGYRHVRARLDANPESDALVLAGLRVALRHPTLNLSSAAHRVHDTRKLRQYSVPGVLYDAAPVLGDLGVDQFPEMGLQPFVSALLIRAHEARISRYVGCEDCGEAADRRHGSPGGKLP
jgi:hypothetical protein